MADEKSALQQVQIDQQGLVQQTQKLWDKKNRQVVEVPFNDVAAYVKSGQYALPDKGTQFVEDETGEMFEIGNQEYKSALDEGYLPSNQENVYKQALEAQYGDANTRAFLESTLSSATLGLTDAAASFTDPEMAKDMALRRQANGAANVLGQVTGVVAPAILSGGTSLLGKAAAATPAMLAERAGLEVTKQVAKQVAKVLPKNKVAANIIESIVPRAAGLATEGAIFGVGETISEAALGQADFTAQALLSNVGVGAAIGGTFGSAFGSAKVLADYAKPMGQGVISRMTGMADFFDQQKNFEELIGATKVKDYKKIKNEFFDIELARRMSIDENKIGLKMSDGLEDFLEKTEAYREKVGRQLDDIYETSTATLDAPAFYNDMAKHLEDTYVRPHLKNGEINPAYTKLVKTADSQATKFREYAKAFQPGEKISVANLNAERRQWDTLSKWSKDATNDEVQMLLARDLRKQFSDLIQMGIGAEGKAGLETFEHLRALNKEYGSLAHLNDSLLNAAGSASRRKTPWTIKDLFFGGLALQHETFSPVVALIALKNFAHSDLKRKAVLLYGAEKAKVDWAKSSLKSVRNFLESPKLSRPAELGAFKLSQSYFGTDEREKKPKNEKEAYINMSEKVQKYAANPEILSEQLVKRGIKAHEMLPNTMAEVHAATTRAVEFLNQKLPKKINQPGVLDFRKPYVPSDIQIKKMERYLQIIEKPQTLLKNLESGTLTREHVEAMQAVYPALYEDVRQNVMQYVEHQPSLPYQKKVQLGLLLDIPADESLQPANVSALQANFSAQQEQPGVQPTVTGMGKLGKAERTSLSYRET